MKMLSHKVKLPGYILIFLGMVMTYLYFITNVRIEIPVLAIISSFTETSFFTSYKTNFADELIILFFISGFSLVAFSKENSELGIFREMRIQAIYKTILIDICLLVFTTLFIFGGGFMAFIIINIILPFIIYLIIFNILKYSASRNIK